MTHAEIAQELQAGREQIVLIYAFNSIGKTRLSVAYKDLTKDAEGNHSGVYYNAFSEDLLTWDNDIAEGESNIRLLVKESRLSRFHGALNEVNIHAKLKPYQLTFDFRFKLFEDPERGIESIEFFLPSENEEDKGNEPAIKISRGEERIFVWCFFLALMDVEGWADRQSSHFFIDDPVSSLDDHNIFITASTILDLIEKHHENRKVIVTTHHIGLYSILYDCLKKGEKSGTYKARTRACLLSGKSGSLTLETERNDVFLYHLRVLQILEHAQQQQNVRSYHFALLRQVLENVSSFLGVGRVSFVIEQIGIDEPEEVTRIVNALSHKNVYYYESDTLVQDNVNMFNRVFDGLKSKYAFVLHAPEVAAANVAIEAPKGSDLTRAPSRTARQAKLQP